MTRPQKNDPISVICTRLRAVASTGLRRNRFPFFGHLLLALAAASTVAPAHAVDIDSASMAVMLNFNDAAKERSSKVGSGASAVLIVPWTSELRTTFDVGAFVRRFPKKSRSWTESGLYVGSSRYFPITPQFHPFVGVEVSFVRSGSSARPSSNYESWAAKGGFRFQAANDWTVHAALVRERSLSDFADTGEALEEWSFRLGLSVPLSKVIDYVSATPERQFDLDSDHDGVPDRLDACPESEPGISVGPDGCSVRDAAK